MPTPPAADGARFIQAFRHEMLSLELFARCAKDPRQPHHRDEAWVVVAGRSIFVTGGRRHAFGAGDFPFAPVHVRHRFEEFGDDLAVWLMLYGPEGGETAWAVSGWRRSRGLGLRRLSIPNQPPSRRACRSGGPAPLPEFGSMHRGRLIDIRLAGTADTFR